MYIARDKIDAINKFWVWFSENCQGFGRYFENQLLIDELDNRISAIGDVSWEIGPGKTKENALVISPNGDPELLQFTKQIIDKSIKCDNWEYYYVKPPKQWKLRFEFQSSNGEEISIDASQWQYVLLKYEDGMFEIIIKAVKIKKLNTNDKLVAAEILLDGILGEELRINTICDIEVVEEFEKIYLDKANDIAHLLNQINEESGRL